MIPHLVDTLDQQQLRPTAGLPLLAAPLAATAFTALGLIKTFAVTEGWPPLRGSLAARKSCETFARSARAG